MKIFAETDRLILREFEFSDEEVLFELESDPDVRKFLGDRMEHIGQARAAIEAIRKDHYEVRGIGRWAIVEKSTHSFLGLGGLRYMKELTNGHTGYFDVGYRLNKRYWGRGFATECARASVKYGFEVLAQEKLHGISHVDNLASRRVLENAGLRRVEEFDDSRGDPHVWFEITREDWQVLRGAE